MKNIAFCSYNLDIGGIETALISLLKNIDYTKYNVTLFLVKKEGIFLKEVPEQVKIIGFNMCTTGNPVIRKIKNLYKLTSYKIKYKNKFDFSACYATTERACTKLAFHFSENNAIWIHGNFAIMLEDNKEFNNFLKFININKYKNIVFVAEDIKKSFEERNVSLRGKQVIFNNLIDYKKIIQKSKEEIIQKRKTTFINVSRYEEKQKKLLMMLSVINRLKKEGYDFDLWMIGDGPDKDKYTEYVNNNNLNDVVTFLGKMDNPFVYYKASDATLLSSFYEGNPVVFVEARILGIPIITTDVSDAMKDIQGRYGIVTNKTEEDFYNGIKSFLDNGFKPKTFDPEKFNQEILEKLFKIIDE